MKETPRRQESRRDLDLIEEATHLLRTAPAATLAAYYSGTVPFVLGLLYFWSEMSRSPMAPQHLPGGAFGMAGLFLWMKCWQAVYARRIRAQAAREKMPSLGFRRAARLFVTQAIVQPSGLFLLPLAALPLLPLPRAYAFFQSASALDEGDHETAALIRTAWKQAALWPRQNHLVLVFMAGFGFCVFLNWTTVCIALPHLFKMLFGIESVFTQSPFAFLNTTFFAGMCGLTYLCVDPILKAIYALRCFYGESLQSGADLKADLKPFIDMAVKTATALLLGHALLCGLPARAEPAATGPATGSGGVAPADLDRAIQQTIHEHKFTWRLPRKQAVEDQDAHEGLIGKFFHRIRDMIRDWVQAVLDWLHELLRKIFSRGVQSENSSFGIGGIMALHALLYGLLAVALAALVILLIRILRRGRQPATVLSTEPIESAPDLTDENVRADQLPEDGWTKLGRELLERGEFRLAMRAFYLAALAHLASRHLVSIATFKSNRDYERELRRRAHSVPGLPDAFGENVGIFERVWYGTHEASRELADQFATGIDRLKGAG